MLYVLYVLIVLEFGIYFYIFFVCEFIEICIYCFMLNKVFKYNK